MSNIMKRNVLFLMIALTGFALVSCMSDSSPEGTQQNPVAENMVDSKDRTTLSLRASTSGNDVTLDIFFGRGAPAAGPRIAEIVLSYSQGLAFESCDKGEVLEHNQKDLVVQTPESGQLRAVIYSSSNLRELTGGTLFTCYFKRMDSNRQKIEITTQKPIFAPSQANEGLLVGDPIVFE